MPRKSFGDLYRLVESGEAATASRVEELLSHLEQLAGRLEAAVKAVPLAPPVHQDSPASPVDSPAPAAAADPVLPEPEPAAPVQRPAETPWRPAVKPEPKPVQPRGRGLLGGLSDAWQRFRGLKDHVVHSAWLASVNEASLTDEVGEIVQGIRQVAQELKGEFQKVAQQGGNQELIAQMRSMMDEFGSKLSTMGGGSGMGGGGMGGGGGGKSKVNMSDLMYNLVQLANAMELMNGGFASKIPEGSQGREQVVRVRPGQSGQFTANLPTQNPGQLRRVASASIQSGDTQWTVKVFFPKVPNAPDIQTSAAQNQFTFDITDEGETIEATNWVKETAPIVFNELLKRLRGRIGNRRKKNIPTQADDYDSQGPALGPRPDLPAIPIGDSYRRRGRRLW